MMGELFATAAAFALSLSSSVTAADVNEALQNEFIRISQLPQSERMSVESPDVMALMQKCFTNTQ